MITVRGDTPAAHVMRTRDLCAGVSVYMIAPEAGATGGSKHVDAKIFQSVIYQATAEVRQHCQSPLFFPSHVSHFGLREEAYMTAVSMVTTRVHRELLWSWAGETRASVCTSSV